MVFPYFSQNYSSLSLFCCFFTTHLFFTTHYSTTARHATRTPANILQSSQVILSCHPFSTFSIYHTYSLYTFLKKKNYILLLSVYQIGIPKWQQHEQFIVVLFPTVMLLVFLFLHESRFECKMSCTISFTAAANQSHYFADLAKKSVRTKKKN